MSAPAGAQRDPRPSVVSMRMLLAAGVAATAVSTPPARDHVPAVAADAVAHEEAAPESEAA
ncbi:hypothetical protein ABT234_12740 [Streptomyces sp. NPDC001586]|uniref:hypothetical protein n=1 Tax=Streptomyces sp. NPDC001586 TaxID=3154387 RepID=UPI00332CEF0F